jgi:hypothetical protein
MRQVILGFIAIAALSIVPALAQESDVETVVVTGSRIAGYDSEAPDVTLTQRADHLITKVQVVCDTRDLDKRKEELRETLRNMIAEAEKTSSISLSVGDEILVPFTDRMLDKVIVPDSRADTSDAYVVIRTELNKSDTFDGATQRIKDYIERTAKTGRTEILTNQPWNLGLKTPERYRDELIGKIASSTNQTAKLFGANYEVRIVGLQHRIQWYQTGPLDLALYIPYELTVAPHIAP